MQKMHLEMMTVMLFLEAPPAEIGLGPTHNAPKGKIKMQSCISMHQLVDNYPEVRLLKKCPCKIFPLASANFEKSNALFGAMVAEASKSLDRNVWKPWLPREWWNIPKTAPTVTHDVVPL